MSICRPRRGQNIKKYGIKWNGVGKNKLKFGKREKSVQFLRRVTRKKLSKPIFLQCQFVGQDMVRTFKEFGIKWNGVEKID